ncbi:ABC transporter ATP-binding protein [Azospirillum sp. RWY-5-1]|uniref:ABC transporter ATP-binding protein n=1 Tax=Azospirillum oleiclasticum TaxID=2735135 RepID=A0ABX2TGD7_9PROT|nr:ABC transporter ATP-binding protein [Azospirillum oleiclasticum]NYZ14255.1 ABC transporter ATP-binding protein [Azospirillum oleiclasticum]NYZ21740.1 ABC transporter ATP-binding protein [Azospirillum oleiclasticum]
MDHHAAVSESQGSRPSRLRAALRERTAGWFGRGEEPPAPCGAAPVTLSGRPAIDALGPREPRAAVPLEALALDAVTHRFGTVTAVDDVTVTVGAGEIVCLCGPSGCGKSTLLRIAAGLETLQLGEVRVGGRMVAGEAGAVPPERRGVGLVFQDYALFPHLSVLDNVRFGLSALPADEQRRRALDALRQVGMGDHADRFPHHLSGGQQQRVALARALAPNPAVLLLDEPFSGLDARLREQVRDETLHVLKRTGAATMLVTHDPEEAMFLADRIVLMRDGRVEQVGCPVDLYTRPATAYAAAFFGEVNALTGVVRGGTVDTPVGRLAVEGHACGCCVADGASVEVLIRPEALKLAPLTDGVPGALPTIARVAAARLLGRSSLVHLNLPDGRGGTVHLHARMPGQFLPAEGSHLSVELDRTQAFVFPASVTK